MLYIMSSAASARKKERIEAKRIHRRARSQPSLCVSARKQKLMFLLK
jgi:hypothetical protein